MLALVGALNVAHAFFVPLLIGILVSYSLWPLVDWLKVCHVPRFIGAALVLVALTASLIWVAAAVSGQAAAMLEKLPDAARQLRYHMINRQTGTPTIFDNVQEAAKELQAAAAAAAAVKTVPKAQLIVAREPEVPDWLRDYVLATVRAVLSVAAQAPMCCCSPISCSPRENISGASWCSLSAHRCRARRTRSECSRKSTCRSSAICLPRSLANTLVGVGTWLAFLALGMEQAGVWGVAAGVLHFIPYLGPVLIALASGVAAFMQFGSLLMALRVAGVSLLVAGAIGFGFMTWLQSRFARVNAAVLFIALLFFGWLWGVWGLLLGAPLVAIAKVICDRVESLKPVGELLGS